MTNTSYTIYVWLQDRAEHGASSINTSNSSAVHHKKSPVPISSFMTQ